ncbi:hypothetical protein N9L68_08185 [bacterium]|nr:hypothetical protein [bacterium]
MLREMKLKGHPRYVYEEEPGQRKLLIAESLETPTVLSHAREASDYSTSQAKSAKNKAEKEGTSAVTSVANFPAPSMLQSRGAVYGVRLPHLMR